MKVKEQGCPRALLGFCKRQRITQNLIAMAGQGGTSQWPSRAEMRGDSQFFCLLTSVEVSRDKPHHKMLQNNKQVNRYRRKVLQGPDQTDIYISAAQSICLLYTPTAFQLISKRKKKNLQRVVGRNASIQ